MNVPDVAHLELDTTHAGTKRPVSKLRVKKFFTPIHGSIPPVSGFPLAQPECSKHSNEVKPSQQTCHILLCSYSAGDGQDVLDAWHSLDWQTFSRRDITHFISQMFETCSTSSYFWTRSDMDFFSADFSRRQLLLDQGFGIRRSWVRYHYDLVAEQLLRSPQLPYKL